MASGEGGIAEKLSGLVVSAGLRGLTAEQCCRFEAYMELLLKWNARMNLTSIRDVGGILERHFLECIECAWMLPEGIETLLDFGSGGGFPGVPIGICRPEVRVTLAESQGKKAAFLAEVVRVLGLGARVHSGRAEELGERFGCVTLRAVDRMEEAVRAGARLVAAEGWLALLSTEAGGAELVAASGEGFEWEARVRRLPGGDRRVLLLGRQRG